MTSSATVAAAMTAAVNGITLTGSQNVGALILSLRGPGRKYGTPLSGWQKQLVSRIGVSDHAPRGHVADRGVHCLMGQVHPQARRRCPVTVLAGGGRGQLFGGCHDNWRRQMWLCLT